MPCLDNEWIGILLQDYDHRHFIKPNGSFDFITNVEVITKLTTERYGIHLDGNKIEFGNHIILLPFDYLCAFDTATGEVKATENIYTIHHFFGSWLSEDLKKFSQRSNQYYQQYKKYPIPKELAVKLAKVRTAYELGGVTKVLSKTINMITRKSK